MERNDPLQTLCRDYLCKLRYLANKHGLGTWLRDIVKANKRGECEATKSEVEALGRMVDEERVERTDIPRIMGLTYRQCFDQGHFERIKKLPRVGIYSKVDAMVYADKVQKSKKR